MSNHKYPVMADGEWLQPRMRGYKMRCCDCGLIHILDFRVISGLVQFRAMRDHRATAQTAERRRLRVARSSVAMLLDDARQADQTSGHTQRENWRFGVLDYVMAWFDRAIGHAEPVVPKPKRGAQPPLR